MMTSAQIVELSNEMARRAARAHRRPYVPYDETEIRNNPQILYSLPNIGSYRPPDYEQVDYWTVDKFDVDDSGPALSWEQLRAQMLQDMAETATYGYAIIEEGPFQCVVGKFKQVEEKPRRRNRRNRQKEAPFELVPVAVIITKAE